jgi:PAS domain S-box-containing protein
MIIDKIFIHEREKQIMKNIAQKDSDYKIGRVIVVDDETELNRILCEMLASQGYEVTGFLTGAEALAVLKEREFDLLVTDLMMPGMDGIELIRAGLEIDPNLIGIIMTGHGTVQTAVEAMKTGAFDYILKPFKLNTLLPLLSRAMQVRNLRLENMQLKETVAIHELGKAISFSSDLNSILNKIADAALQQCSADEVSIMLPTKNGRELYVAVVRGGRTENLGEHAPIEQGIAGWVARNRESVVFKGEVNDPRMAPIRPRNDIHIAVSMPMLSQSKLVGVLNVNITKSHRQFTLGQLKALSILVSIIAPILENTALYIQIRKAEENYRSIFENAIEGIFQRLPDGRIISANPSFARVFGYDSPEDLMENVTDFVRQVYVDPNRGAEFNRLMDTVGNVRNFEYQARCKDGSQVWVSVNARAVRDEKGVLLYYEGMSEDVTERILSESRLKLAKEILETLNRPNDIKKLINDILCLFKESTGIEAIGIRLKDGEDYPYFVSTGFTPHFLEMENHLCERDAAGEMIRDSEGNPYLECMCGNILSGRTDPSKPFFTEAGSFWSNGTTKLLASTTDQERQTRTRNRCNSEGYESVALIPLRSGTEIVGLLQLNDARQNQFTHEMIRFLEGISASIGIAIARQRSIEKIRENEAKFRSIVTHVDSMYLVNRDCTYLFMNERHLKRFCLSLEEVAGKKYGEFHSKEDTRQFSGCVGDVVETGKESTKEHRSERDGRYFLRTFTPITDQESEGYISQIAVISKDITDIKLSEEKLRETLDRLRKAVDTTIQVMVSAVESRDPYTAGHQLKSASLARAIATEMELPQEKIDAIRMAGSIHDIGKLSIPAEILSKPTKLSELEFSLIKAHAERGFEMLKDVESPWPLAEIVYQHHERMDGSGYPRNLKGEEICMEARILTIADVVEAMASHRPYRPGLGIESALAEIEKHRGIYYDKAAADACLRLFREKGYKLEGI